MAIPSKARALIKTQKGKVEVQTVPTPKLRDNYVLVKTTAVALNPTEPHAVFDDDTVQPGSLVGCDFAGVVVEAGDNSRFKPGDRIAGMAHGGNAENMEDGAFAEYINVKDGIALKIPDNITDEQAATLGVGVTTVGQGLYQALRLPLPNDAEAVAAHAGTPILIYGGSTATGVLGIQYAKLSGLRVLATASPRNHEYLKSIGADEVYDHSSPTWVDEVRKSTGGRLRLCWDCIARDGSPQACARALDQDEPGAVYRNLLPVEDDEVKSVNPVLDGPAFTLGYTAFGEDMSKLGKNWPASKEDYEFAKVFWKLTEDLLAQGKLKPVRQQVDRGGKGLEHVFEGIQDLRDWKVSGSKLVYHVA
ncbi:hypothetical protein MGG_05132 [Pyricularia oryzae 70-15]|uniref:Enoyl reductase (ER) domain-containing protein n=3 Tax=Pyricularia oryzae TaxID=318829 RepID=G4N4N9_PYRO7|nr:uncharacterized protein MGG_05132 [Pyricularia oryzae 70-15]EHA52854.1 hypothetical protein MGG_05132 [Pyricularia oryzae 70-15]ELQ38974.1 hypothetical protein OOU_Y34scaffold00516g9 [Pyricularia oryzae Y34]KAI7927635.1 hypothetical protein M0657_003037 [Pyricularia oryzae]KAI7930671.1 hypothetical protein M9X92_000735 [Pyricularia oryzae]